MQPELIIPIVAGALFAVIGIGLILDAWTPDEILVTGERRRRPRAERSRGGEALLGFGVLCLAAAFVGRDEWKYRTLAALAGSILLFWGTLLNRHFLGELIGHRGRLRRGAGRG